MRKELIVVLGMHRSGTSAVARGLQVFGVALGKRLSPAMADNEKGFWEDRDITALNIDMLRAIDSDWHHVAAIDQDDVETLEAAGYRSRALELLSQKVDTHELFGVKDPRMAKLLPFWKPVLEELGCGVSYVLAIRNPLSVQRSLSKRNDLDPTLSCLLWLGHVLESLRLTAGERRALVDYDLLLADPERQLVQLAGQLGLRLDEQAMAEYLSDFLDAGLRHSQFDAVELHSDRTCPPLVQEVYSALFRVASGALRLDGDEISSSLTQWTEEFDRMSSLLGLVDNIGGKMVSEKERASAALSQAKAERDAVAAERDAVAAERDVVVAERDAIKGERDAVLKERDFAISQIETIWSSFSWRVTRPLRVTARLLRHGYTRDAHTQLVARLRGLYHRLPLPVAARRALSRVYHRAVSPSIRSARRTFAGVPKFGAPKVYPAAREQGKPDYLFWGVIDWHFRHQRPQHLAESLASTGRRVFYFSPVLADAEHGGFEVESLDDAGRLFQIKLYAKNPPPIYSDPAGLDLTSQLRASIGEVLNWAACTEVISLVQHPFWHAVAAVLPNSRLVYDCMDHHEGFGDFAEPMLELERLLFEEAELTIVTSKWLEDAVAPNVQRHALIRNAGEYAHFATPPTEHYRDPHGRKVIGYYGAIAEWFDTELVEAIARQHPDCCVLLIGADTANVRGRLGRLPNVTFLGERPYGELPFYLHGFDVCMLPFKVIPLTLATNPVKAYEYLSAGKPIVTSDLPEMAQFGDLVYAAKDSSDFLRYVRDILEGAEPHDLALRRQAFAAEQTWAHRAERLVDVAEDDSQDPSVSVIVVTYNNLDLTQACLRSIEEHSQYGRLEIIVVDNASSDGSPEYLEAWASAGENRRLILNEDNRGFAAANNQGLRAATGDYLVLLNNDTFVTPGWIRTMLGHLRRDRTVGLVGPVTNNIGNEAKIDIAYKGMTDMLVRSAAYTQRHIGQTYPLRTAAFFCVMMPRSTFERVGLLDESFGRGFFEDDDYCRRIEKEGLRVVCAEDVFVHHHLSASFDKLKQSERQQLFEDNKKLYEQKWGQWVPHGYREYRAAATAFSTSPASFDKQQFLAGECIVCGKQTRFFYADAALWRESLNCEHCRTTSRYRSVTRGILRAVGEISGVKASSLATLPHLEDRSLRVYDTQPPFYYETCAYPLPDLLKNAGWIEVELSQYKPQRPLGSQLAAGITNQNLESLTFDDESLDVVITSDVMEHVRLDEQAHREILRVLRPGGAYVFTVPHDRSWETTLTRVQITDPDDPSKDVHLLEPEYHGDTNNEEGKGVLAYRAYGRDLEQFLGELGFEVEYSRDDMPQLGIMNTELFYCRKKGSA